MNNPERQPIVPSRETLATSSFAPWAPQLIKFADALLAAPFRAVGPRTRERVLDEIVLDSLAPHVLGLLPESGFALDLGCGPGIPLLPLALVTPSLRWTGMDSATKRLSFVTSLCAEFEFGDRVRVSEHRVGMYGNRQMGIRRSSTPPSTIQPFIARQDLVVARGTAPIVDVVAMAAGFLSPSGRLLIFATDESAATGMELLSRTDWSLDVTQHTYQREASPDRRYAILDVKPAP